MRRALVALAVLVALAAPAVAEPIPVGTSVAAGTSAEAAGATAAVCYRVVAGATVDPDAEPGLDLVPGGGAQVWDCGTSGPALPPREPQENRTLVDATAVSLPPTGPFCPGVVAGPVAFDGWAFAREDDPARWVRTGGAAVFAECP